MHFPKPEKVQSVQELAKAYAAEMRAAARRKAKREASAPAPEPTERKPRKRKPGVVGYTTAEGRGSSAAARGLCTSDSCQETPCLNLCYARDTYRLEFENVDQWLCYNAWMRSYRRLQKVLAL